MPLTAALVVAEHQKEKPAGSLVKPLKPQVAAARDTDILEDLAALAEKGYIVEAVVAAPAAQACLEANMDMV
jgi:hypothetical protein